MFNLSMSDLAGVSQAGIYIGHRAEEIGLTTSKLADPRTNATRPSIEWLWTIRREAFFTMDAFRIYSLWFNPYNHSLQLGTDFAGKESAR
jgi:hypothetical protein